MASRATWFIDHQPATHAAATTAKTRALFLMEKSMMRLTTAPPGMRNDAGCGRWLDIRVRPAPFQFILRGPVGDRIRLRIMGRRWGWRVHLCRFLQAAFRADQEVAGNHNSLACIESFHDFHSVIEAAASFHRPGREQPRAALYKDGLLQSRIENRAGGNDERTGESDRQLHV